MFKKDFSLVTKKEVIDLLKQGFIGLLKIELQEIKSNSFVLSLKVTKDHLQAVNIVHGGVLSSLAESCASISAYYNCKLNFKNSFPVALNLNSSYFKEVKEGLTIYARSKCEKSGLNIQFWSVEIYNDKYIFATFKINFLNKTIKIH